MDNPYEWLQAFTDQVPDFLQPVIVALAGAIPYVEGEGAASLGILAGVNPLVAAVAGATGNILCVFAVVFWGARIRDGVVARRAVKRAGRPVDTGSVQSTGSGSAAVAGESSVVEVLDQPADESAPAQPRRDKGRSRLRRWLVRFGVPGASLLAPLALPTMLTAAFFVGSGVAKHWVLLWQVIAIVLWTSAIAVAATGALALLGW